MKVLAAEAKPIAVYDYIELTKPRITLMVVLTTITGFLLANPDSIAFILLVHTVVGTALIAAGASALNMVLEWESDSKMRRTERRPIPSGKLSVSQSILFGCTIAVAGVYYLLYFVNFLTCLLGIISLSLYLLAYTPLKKKTSLCTIIGAIPGAIPPVMGWTAARNSLNFEACWLFAILFLWQLPHFLAIAWLYREDYARGGFPMLPVSDQSGRRTSRQIIFQSISLVIVSLLPSMFGNFGRIYFAGAILLGAVFLFMAIRLSRTRTNVSARNLLLTSVIYLPLLMGLMVIEKF
jgi:protoheme IX farnesyltransferase